MAFTITGMLDYDIVGSEDSGTAISILENGEVDGDARTVDVFIAGVDHGNVYATEVIFRLMHTARVRKDVEYACIGHSRRKDDSGRSTQVMRHHAVVDLPASG